MRFASEGKKSAFRFAGCLTTFLASSIAAGLLIYAWFDWKATVTITGPPPNSFPVVVVTPVAGGEGHTAQVVWQEGLEAFTRSHPNVSFIVPPAEAESLRTMVEASTRSAGHRDAGLWFATFTLKVRGDGSQELEVDGTNDDDYVNRSWYSVRDGRVVPGRHLHYFGPGVGMAFGMPAFLVLAIVNFLIWRRAWR